MQNKSSIKRAFVSRSLNQDWPMWAAVIPGKQTTWHDSEYAAKVKVQEWEQDNAANPQPKVMQ